MGLVTLDRAATEAARRRRRHGSGAGSEPLADGLQGVHSRGATHRTACCAAFKSEFAAITDVPLDNGNPRHRFVSDTLRDAGIEPVSMEGFRVWVAKRNPRLP